MNGAILGAIFGLSHALSGDGWRSYTVDEGALIMAVFVVAFGFAGGLLDVGLRLLRGGKK